MQEQMWIKTKANKQKNRNAILSFLQKNKSQTYTIDELYKNVKMSKTNPFGVKSRESVYWTVRQLFERDQAVYCAQNADGRMIVRLVTDAKEKAEIAKVLKDNKVIK